MEKETHKLSKLIIEMIKAVKGYQILEKGEALTEDNRMEIETKPKVLVVESQEDYIRTIEDGGEMYHEKTYRRDEQGNVYVSVDLTIPKKFPEVYRFR